MEGHWEVFTHCGCKPTEIDTCAWAGRMAEYGLGEILLTGMDHDDTKDGYDLPSPARLESLTRSTPRQRVSTISCTPFITSELTRV